jgi:mitogen-activated protein kinase kinase
MPLLPDSARGVVSNNVQIIHVEAKREMRKRIVRELQIMHSCHSDYIVTFYGAFLNDNNDVIMCMEYADVG